jgi:hypothetical protein
MDNTVFRTKQEPTTQVETPMISKEAANTESAVEVPYMDYEVTHSKPFSVDYFELGDTWQDPDGGFTKEVGTIETYLQEEIKSGKLANSVTAIKEALKGIEKLNNVKKEERQIVKVGIVANYMRFLMDNKKLMGNVSKYSI